MTLIIHVVITIKIKIYLHLTTGICETEIGGAENCYSVLVETGVYSRSSKQMVSLGNYILFLKYRIVLVRLRFEKVFASQCLNFIATVLFISRSFSKRLSSCAGDISRANLHSEQRAGRSKPYI